MILLFILRLAPMKCNHTVAVLKALYSQLQSEQFPTIATHAIDCAMSQVTHHVPAKREQLFLNINGLLQTSRFRKTIVQPQQRLSRIKLTGSKHSLVNLNGLPEEVDSLFIPAFAVHLHKNLVLCLYQ